ncbi:hypothetical protein L2E82_39862 [Cichorium intybus]|uniref:Uncharacterized protein n=1 Tax=Cichorium intybus TaxID=13427 RepID=A0ACB9AL42_CICIN|nr:hypothetical protein L2E82_39862 [Cichorium intybus]
MGVKGFVQGGIASIITRCLTHPLDLIKVRMQLQGESAHVFALNGASCSTMTMPRPPTTGPISEGVNIFGTEGVVALFSGVSVIVLHQTLYSTTRMGPFEIFKEKWSDPNTGTTVENPADVTMARMQADGRLPAAQWRNYKGVADAISRMVKHLIFVHVLLQAAHIHY